MFFFYSCIISLMLKKFSQEYLYLYNNVTLNLILHNLVGKCNILSVVSMAARSESIYERKTMQ